MQWWNNVVAWFYSSDGWRVISGAIIPFLAIVVAGFIAAAIGRGSTKRVLSLSDRGLRVAAVTALLGAARRASVWNTLSGPEQQHADQVASEADIRLRLLAVPGVALASEWAAHEITQMKKNSVAFSFQAEQSLIIVRDRLIDWQARPNRAKKLFKNDLDSWAYESSLSDQELIHQQQAWAAQQAARPADPPPTVQQPTATDDSTFSPSGTVGYGAAARFTGRPANGPIDPPTGEPAP
ncbi:MAG: hypothetical protein ACYCZY_03425 [Lacisediminihabitans sp.]